MATLTFNLDGSTYRFQGWGTAPCIYEKGRPLNNYAGNLGASAWEQYCDDMGLFTWLWGLPVGGEHYRESASGLNYPAKKQSQLLTDLLSRTKYRIILTPFGAPSSCMSEDDQTTLRANGTELTAAHDVTTRQAFESSSGNWQAWTDALAHGIQLWINAGGNVEMVGTPAEYGHTGGYLNYWLAYLTNTQVVDWVKNVWLGSGVTGGGIIDRFPWLKLVNDDPVSGTGMDAIDDDVTAGPVVDYWGSSSYGDGMSSKTAIYGLGSETQRFGKGIAVQFGPNFGALDATAIRYFVRSAHQMTGYLSAYAALQWASMRDTTAKLVADGRGGSYSLRCLFDLDTDAGTYEYTPVWWAMKPYLLAAGRGPVDAYRATPQTALDADANFTPATGVYASLFRRDDGGVGFVYANFSGGARTDTIHFNEGGGNASLTGTRTDYLPMAGSGNEGTPAAISTTAGDITLTSVATSTIVLLQL